MSPFFYEFSTQACLCGFGALNHRKGRTRWYVREGGGRLEEKIGCSAHLDKTRLKFSQAVHSDEKRFFVRSKKKQQIVVG